MPEKTLAIVRTNAAKQVRERNPKLAALMAELKEIRKKPKLNVNIQGWAHIRKAVIVRDCYICRICGDDDCLNVHHIDSNRANNETTNLVTLCSACHRAVHQENYKPYEHEDYPAPWGIIE